jgi:hypothetical protein
MYSSPNDFRMSKSGRMRWEGYVARMEGRGEVHTGCWCGDLREIDHLEDLSVEGRIILKSSRSGIGRHGLDLCDSG